jgi:hypothetical protein
VVRSLLRGPVLPPRFRPRRASTSQPKA